MIKHSWAWHCGYGMCFFLICILISNGVGKQMWNKSKGKWIAVNIWI